MNSDWRPIETAPKDGTWFLSWEPICADMAMTCWCRRPRSQPGYWRRIAPWLPVREMRHMPPTHWMPLPPPPVES